MEVDLILINGIIRTLNPSLPLVEAIAVSKGRIIALGSTNDIQVYRQAGTRVFNLERETVLPGFIDAHQHLVYMGLSFQQIDASADSVSDIGEIIDLVRQKARMLQPGTWIEGHGYNDARLKERRNLTRADLDIGTTTHPVFLTRMCGHVMTLNSRALEEAGIDSNTPDPPGGVIDRDSTTGEPTGILRENAMTLLRKVVPSPSDLNLKKAILDGAIVNLKKGITSVWEPSIEPNHLRVYQEMAEKGELPIRVTMAHKKVLRSGEEVPLPRPFRSPRLSLVAIKLFQDGGFGAATAALSEPYSNQPDSEGILIWPQAKLNQWAKSIHQNALRISIHAIGDRAITSALNAIQYAQGVSPRNDMRHRIEHCGLPLLPLPRRLAELNVVPVVQPSFLWYDGNVYLDRVGNERSHYLYPIRTLLDHGLQVAGSSDGPVIPDISPLLGIYAAVARTSRDGTPVGPKQAISIEEAIQLFTTGAAYALGEEEIKGSLEPGKVADLIVLGEDPMSVPLKQIPDIPIKRVFVDGAEVALT
jgi:predicted amidohydrolase YtcJ